MGCGGFDRLFGMFDYYGYPVRGCGGHDIHGSHNQNESQEKMDVLKKIYADGLIDDMEYQQYRQRIYNGQVSFDELMELRMRRPRAENYHTDNRYESELKFTEDEYQNRQKIYELKRSRVKLMQVRDKLLQRIQELQKEKKSMEAIAETVLKSSEEKAEDYIREKLDIEENLQDLEKRKEELENESQSIEKLIKTLETKELELEAIRLQQELSNLRKGLDK